MNVKKKNVLESRKFYVHFFSICFSEFNEKSWNTFQYSHLIALYFGGGYLPVSEHFTAFWKLKNIKRGNDFYGTDYSFRSFSADPLS